MITIETGIFEIGMIEDKIERIVLLNFFWLRRVAGWLWAGLRGRSARDSNEKDRIQLKQHQATKKNLFFSFLRLGLTAFGGPAMVSHIKEISVTRYKWLDEPTFKDGIALCQSIPGATAMQMAAYVGLRTGGVIGALMSYTAFGLPACVLMLILSMLYVRSHNLPEVISLFSGLQVVVVAIIANATYSFGKGTLKDFKSFFIAAVSAVLFYSGISPFLIIIGISILSIIWIRDITVSQKAPQTGEKNRQMFRQGVLLVTAIAAGLAVLYFSSMKLLELVVLMLKIDLFAFGGGFASLPLMFHEIVNAKGWLDSKTLMEGVALGQITPGPIIITATFVGYLMYGFLGSVVASIAIFTPSFFALIVVTPFFDRLKTSPYFLRAIKGILASFIGLLLFVAVTFAVAVPWDITRFLVCAASLGALLLKVDILYVVIITASLSPYLFT